MQIDEIKDQICDVCHKMWQLGWVAANDGNVSVRLDDGTFLATPTGMLTTGCQEIKLKAGIDQETFQREQRDCVRQVRLRCI